MKNEIQISKRFVFVITECLPNELQIVNILKLQLKYGGGGGSRTRVRKSPPDGGAD